VCRLPAGGDELAGIDHQISAEVAATKARPTKPEAPVTRMRLPREI
jgi:hypothetical protein